MTYQPDRPAGIRGEISGYVVAEDQTLETRLRRSYQAARHRAEDAVGQMREVVSPAVEVPEHPAAPATDARVERIKTILSALRADAARLATNAGKWVGASLVRLELLDRAKDLAALLWTGIRVLARMFWQLPGTAQVVILTIVTLGLIVTWPGPSDSEVPAAELPPALRTGEATLPQRFDAELWKSVAAPLPAFHLEAPELDRASLNYRARTHADGARQDVLIWDARASAPGQRRRHSASGALILEYYPGAQPDAGSLYVDITRRAALAGASVERIGESVGLETKFGVFETAEAQIGIADGRRSCLAFRHLADAVPLQIHGMMCGTAQQPIDRTALACILDRIDLISAGKDQAFRAYFAETERARRPCGT
ncbi:MAG: hypothetical protein LCH61_11930, partial [Proteobacteria bacterium]|nr:hypothetical protein [Pseudomonadota bacterium]